MPQLGQAVEGARRRLERVGVLHLRAGQHVGEALVGS